MSRLLALTHTVVILLFMTGIYWWIATPVLSKYSLQLFCGLVLTYFIVKKLNRATIWHLLPANMSVEVALSTAAFLLVIGSTGNLSSPLFPLVYINLFFLIFASHTGTAIFVTFGQVLFHFALATQFSNQEVSSLISLPLIMTILLFAKSQYQQSATLIQQEKNEVYVFIETFLKPKLVSLQTIVQQTKQNQPDSENIQDITLELENLEHHLAGYLRDHQTSDSTANEL